MANVDNDLGYVLELIRSLAPLEQPIAAALLDPPPPAAPRVPSTFTFPVPVPVVPSSRAKRPPPDKRLGLRRPPALPGTPPACKKIRKAIVSPV